MATPAASQPSGPVLSIPRYRSASPTRVKLAGGGATRTPGKFVRVSSPSSTGGVAAAATSRPSCMCSSTNHPGSFRCSLHKERKPASPPSIRSACSMGWKRMDSAQCARRALAPSPAAQQSQHRRRAGVFRPRPSRLSAMSTAG